MSTNVIPSPEQDAWISNIARSFGRSYVGQLDPEDVYQELMAKWYEQHDKLAPYLNDEDEQRGKARILVTLQRWASTYCRKEIEDYRKFHGQDIYYYSRKELMRLLPHVYDPEWFVRGGGQTEDEHTTGGKDAAEGGDMLAAYADLTAAWEALRDEERSLLEYRYVDAAEPRPYAEIGELLGIPEDTARRRANRALERMQTYLGGVRRRG